MSELYVTWCTDKDGNLHLFGEDGEVAIGPIALAALAEQIVTPAKAAEVLELSADDLDRLANCADRPGATASQVAVAVRSREAASRVRESAVERGEE